MDDESSAPSPLEAADVDDPAATEAFEALGNETRLAILVALWDDFEPFGDDDAVRFTDLRERVGMRDSGQFSYHLDKLEDRFVESIDDGYRLTEAGLTFVQTVLAGAGIEDRTLEPTPVDMTCSLCGGQTEVYYEDGHVYNGCTECDGLFADADRPGGHLSKFTIEPAGLTDRSPEEVYGAAWVRGFQHLYSMIEGVCPTCSGPVEGALDLCEAHAESGVCEACGRQPELTARFRCPVCKDNARTTIGGVAKYHPAAVAFHYERDLPLQYGFNDLDSVNERLERSGSDWELLSADPLRVRVTVSVDDDEMWLDLAADLTVLETSR